MWAKLSDALKTATGLTASEFLTIPQLAYTYVLESVGPGLMKYPSKRADDAWIRGSIQGGRCFAQKGMFISKYAREMLEAAKVNDQEKLKFLHAACDDYLMDFDAVSLYPTAMSQYEYPIGVPRWYEGNELDQVRDALNAMDEKFPLGIVECSIRFPSRSVCPLLSRKTDKARLKYALEECQFVKTTVDVMQAVKYNGAVVEAVHKAMIWPERKAIFREAITKLFNLRLQAKKDKNVALDVACKLAMNSCYGKLIQHIIDEMMEVVDGNTSEEVEMVEKWYENGLVLYDETLTNEEQSLISHKRAGQGRVKEPSYLGAFILAFSKKVINECIAAFDGFNDWNKTFYYTDTDSIHIHANQVEELKQRNPDIYGEKMGQMHDDIKEVSKGKIIRSVFVRPKLYFDEIIGIDRNGKYVIAKHVRSKGVPMKRARTMGFKEFFGLLHGCTQTFKTSRFATCMKDTEQPAVKTVKGTKTINQEQWDGRTFEIETGRWMPSTDDTTYGPDRNCDMAPLEWMMKEAFQQYEAGL